MACCGRVVIAAAAVALMIAAAWPGFSPAGNARTDRPGADSSGMSLLGADARLFTLLRNVNDVAALPGGDVLVIKKARTAGDEVWRLRLDGRLERIGSLPGSGVRHVAVESPTTILTAVVGTRRIERYDLVSGQVGVVADLSATGGRELTQVTLLDDGSLVVTDRFSVWRVRGQEVTLVVPRRQEVEIPWLAALPGGAFAYGASRAVFRVGPDGRRRTLVRARRGQHVLGAASAGEQLVVALSPGGSSSQTRLMRLIAGRVDETVARRDRPVYGNGDGYGPTAAALAPWRMVLATDGSLLVLEDPYLRDGVLRALVPRSSERLRLAIRPTTWRSFVRGRVDYNASTAGALELRVRRAGGATVTRLKARTTAGAGTLRVRRALPRSAYHVSLTLRTPAGGRATATARIVTTTTLTMGAARRALERDFNQDEGDGADAGGDEVSGRCVRRDRRRVECRMITFQTHNENGHEVRSEAACRGWVVAQLRLDGVRTTSRGLRCPD